MNEFGASGQKVAFLTGRLIDITAKNLSNTSAWEGPGQLFDNRILLSLLVPAPMCRRSLRRHCKLNHRRTQSTVGFGWTRDQDNFDVRARCLPHLGRTAAERIGPRARLDPTGRLRAVSGQYRPQWFRLATDRFGPQYRSDGSRFDSLGDMSTTCFRVRFIGMRTGSLPRMLELFSRIRGGLFPECHYRASQEPVRSLKPVFRREFHLRRTARKQGGAIWLPIVDVDLALLGFKDPRTAKFFIGARRQAVMKVVQMLETAKRNQIDGQVQLDVKDVGLLLQASALAVECITEVMHDWLDDDEQT